MLLSRLKKLKKKENKPSRNYINLKLDAFRLKTSLQIGSLKNLVLRMTLKKKFNNKQ